MIKSDLMRVGGSRLNPMLISDSLYRVKLYDEIRQAEGSSFVEYEVSMSETLLPEIIAVRSWNDETLGWVVMIAAGIDDPRREIEAGITIKLPNITWLRDKIRYYQKLSNMSV